MTKIIKTQAGFTLIEMLIYIGILALLMMALSGLAWNVIAGGTRADVAEEIGYNARFALNTINYEISQADKIISPAPGNSASSLELDLDGQTITFSLADGRLWKTEVGGEPQPLTVAALTASELMFLNVGYPGTRGAIKVNFTLESDEAFIQTISREWQATINLPLD